MLSPGKGEHYAFPTAKWNKLTRSKRFMQELAKQNTCAIMFRSIQNINKKKSLQKLQASDCILRKEKMFEIIISPYDQAL